MTADQLHRSVPVDLEAVRVPGLGAAQDDPDREKASKPSNWMAGGYDMVGRLWAQRRARDTNLPDHIRMHYYGMAKMRRDGHCPMSSDELVTMLGKPKLRNDKLKDKIALGVEREFLGFGSNPRCLVMPFDVRFLTTADVRSRCDRH